MSARKESFEQVLNEAVALRRFLMGQIAGRFAAEAARMANEDAAEQKMTPAERERWQTERLESAAGPIRAMAETTAGFLAEHGVPPDFIERGALVRPKSGWKKAQYETLELWDINRERMPPKNVSLQKGVALDKAGSLYRYKRYVGLNEPPELTRLDDEGILRGVRGQGHFLFNADDNQFSKITAERYDEWQDCFRDAVAKKLV